VNWRGFVIPAALLVAAEIGAAATHLQSDALARPSEIIVAGVVALFDGSIFHVTGQTLLAAATGLAIGCSLGVVFGVLLGVFALLNRLMEFSIESLRPIPSVALIPVAMLVFGFGYRMEFSLIAFSCIWPVLILTRAAIAGIEPRLLEISRLLGFNILTRSVKIILPAALPRLFVSFRLAVGISLIVAVTVEIAANPLGLGYAMSTAQQSLRPDLMFALLFWVGLIGWAINGGMIWAQHRLFGAAANVEVQP
jgi:ABC-type nitrate/sulfonate/bicarbonate transport system permease component